MKKFLSLIFLASFLTSASFAYETQVDRSDVRAIAKDLRIVVSELEYPRSSAAIFSNMCEAYMDIAAEYDCFGDAIYCLTRRSSLNKAKKCFYDRHGFY